MKAIKLVNNRDGKSVTPKTYLKYWLDKNFLFFYFEALDSSLNSFSNINNDSLYKGDVVEVFLDLGEEHYYEFEVAPNGATFVAKILNGTLIFIENNFFVSKVEAINSNYYVTMRIDLSKLAVVDEIKFNAFRIETKRIKPEYILEALSPTFTGSFHDRNKFIKIENYRCD